MKYVKVLVMASVWKLGHQVKFLLGCFILVLVSFFSLSIVTTVSQKLVLIILFVFFLFAGWVFFIV